MNHSNSTIDRSPNGKLILREFSFVSRIPTWSWILLFVLLCVSKIVVVTKMDPVSISYLINSANLSQLGLASLITSFEFLIIFLYGIFLTTYFEELREEESSTISGLVLVAVLLLMAVFVTSPYLWLFTLTGMLLIIMSLVYAYMLLPITSTFTNKSNPGRLIHGSKSPNFYALFVVAVSLIVSILAAFSTKPWMPLEKVMIEEREVLGYRVAVNEVSTVIMEENSRGILIELNSKIKSISPAI